MLPPSLQHLSDLQGGNASMLLLIVKATLILIGALAVTLLMRRAAAGARHLVWLVTLGALLLVPALTVWGPIHIGVLPAQQELAASAPTAAGVPRHSVATSTQSATNAFTRDVSLSDNVVAARTPANRAIAWLRQADALSILFAIWATIAFAIAASLAYATFSLRRIVNASTPLGSPDWLNIIWEVSDRLGLEKAPRLLQSREVRMPFACGLLHPTIVLPLESNDWSTARRSAVLLHELAHVRRRDLLGHTLGRVACAVYWFHPLVWAAARHLRSESERACDDLALTCGTRAADYAEHLLEIVTSVRRERTPLVALAMARRKEFEGRMLAILDPQLRRAAPSRRKATALVMSLGILAVVVGASSPVPRAAVAALPKAVVALPDNAQPVGERAEPAHNAALPGVPRVGIGPSELRTAIVTGAGALGVAPKEQTPDERAELLAKILRTDTSASIRRTAAWGLQQYADEVADASSALVWSLRHDASADVREMSAWALADGKDNDAAVIGALTYAVGADASASVRATSAWSLASVGNAGATGALTAALADRSADVRTRAAWALGTLEPKTAPAALVSRLKDSDPSVRAMTAWALYSIADVSSIPALRAALHGEADTNLQVDYIRALAAMGDESIDALRALLVSPDAKIRSLAVKALAGGGATGPWPWPWPIPRPFP